jgi:hypothetical protein
MKSDNSNAKPLSLEEIAHLEKLKSVVEKAIEDGKLSIYETQQIRSLLWADGKVTYEELQTIRKTIKAVMGENVPELEWESYS